MPAILTCANEDTLNAYSPEYTAPEGFQISNLCFSSLPVAYAQSF